MTSDHLNSIFRAWIVGIQKRHNVTVGWVRSIEHIPKLHIHAALVAPVPIDCDYAAALWQAMVAPGYSEAAQIKPYRQERCGTGYILKQLDRPASAIQFSENIAAFADGVEQSRFATSPAQRRQQRRIQEQLERTKSSLLQ